MALRTWCRFVVLFLAGSVAFAGEERPVGHFSLGDEDADLVFTPLIPCRIVDTRVAGGPLETAVPRDFLVEGTEGFARQGGTEGGCAVPLGATSVLINFVAVNPTGAGNLRGWAYPGPIPVTGSIVNYQQLNPNLNIANGLAFPICNPAKSTCDADITLMVNGAGTGVVADVLGYFKRFPREETITAVNAGPGLTGGGSSGDLELAVNFGGGGAANSVARSDHRHFTNTIIVSPVGTPAQNGTALFNAVSGITGSSPANRFLVKIEPGTYDLGANFLHPPSYVDLEGSGEVNTIIRSVGAPEATVYITDHNGVRMLTLESDGNGTAFGVALGIEGESVVSHVRLNVSGGTTFHYGAYVQFGAVAELDHVTVNVNGVLTNGLRVADVGTKATLDNVAIKIAGSSGSLRGIAVSGNATAVGRNVDVFVDASGAAHGYGLYVTGNGGSTAKFSDSSFRVFGTSQVFGIQNLVSALDLSDVVVLAISSAPTSVQYGVDNASPLSTGIVWPVWIRNSRITALSPLRNNATGTSTFDVRVSSSHLDGGPVDGPALCSFITDENHAAFLNTCPP